MSGKSRVLCFALSALLLPHAASALEDWQIEDKRDFRSYSQETIDAVDAAVEQTSALLIARQRKDGSWDGEAAATALAVQALASVEPSTSAIAASVDNGIRFVLESASKNGYAIAYALASTKSRPRMYDQSGLVAQDALMRDLLRDATGWNCTEFKRAVLLLALRNTGTPQGELVALAKELEARPLAPDSPACRALLPDPANVNARALLPAIIRHKFAGGHPLKMKQAFDLAIQQEEGPEKYPAGPLGVSGLLWTDAGLTEIRMGTVEPKRGCLGTTDLLASRLLSLRAKDGSWGETFATASALSALVHNRAVFETDLPFSGKGTDKRP
jgi:hypothetical protein